jgi:hypothetical protein
MKDNIEFFKSCAFIATAALVFLAACAAVYLYLIWPIIPIFD